MNWILYLSLFITYSASANPGLSWQECIDLTAKNNAALKAASSQLESAEYQVNVAKSPFLPQISADLDYSRKGSSLRGTSESSVSNQYGASLSLKQNLFSGLSDAGRVQQANAQSTQAAENLRTVKSQVSLDLKTAFEMLSYAKAYESFSAEIVNRREDNSKLVQLRFENGHENRGSVLLAQAYFKQAKHDLLISQNLRRSSQAQLAEVLGLDHSADLDIVGEVPVKPIEGPAPNFRDVALETPDYRKSLAQEESADAAVTVARSGFFPSLDLAGNLGRSGPDFFPKRQDEWSVGVGLTFPLFTGGKDFYGLKSAISSRSAASSNLHHVSRDVLTRLQQSYAAYTEAISKLEVDESFKQAAVLRAEIARKKYNNGLLSFEDWDQIENDLISRQKNFLQSRRDRVIAEAAWEQVQGKGVIP